MAKIDNRTVSATVALTAAAAATAAGAYWLYGAKNAAKNRRIAKSWMLRARAEVMEAVEALAEIDKETYMRIVDDVTHKYVGVAGATSAEIARAARDLKGSWDHIRQAQAGGRKRKTTKTNKRKNTTVARVKRRVKRTA